MPFNTDWLPGARAAQLLMAKTWIAVVTAKGKEWSVPNKTLDELVRLAADAEVTLAAAEDATTRTQVITETCNIAFAALTAFMRSMKRKYFILGDGISTADFIALGFRVPDPNPSPIPPPQAQAVAEIVFKGPHLMELHMKPLAETAVDPKADYGFRIYRGVYPPGGATLEEAAGPRRYLLKPNPRGADLPHSMFTKRKKEMFDFPEEDSGKTVYFCIRYENSKGEAGPWGPVFSAVIP